MISTSSVLGGGLSSSPARLSTETELQKMLADEKMRSEQHKTNYTTLKTEHTRLQDEYMQLQEELKGKIEESKLVQEKYRQLLDQARKDLAAKHAECEELRTQVMSEQRMEVLKLQLQEEVEDPFRAKLHTAEAEIEQLQTELNKLRYEHSFLQQEYQHERTTHQQVIDEMKLRHEAEVSNLRKERETILARTQTDGGYDQQKSRTLQRENAQLHLKVKGLLSELEEIRAQSEHTGIQSDSVTRLQTKQLAEHAANIKALETEKNSLKMQVENLTRELSTTGDLHTQLTAKVHDLEKENLVLKNRADEISHKSKVDITNVKMEMLRERGVLERERDQLKNHIEELKSQLEISQHTLDQQSSLVAEKERECVERVQAAREEEWNKLHQVENEKMELETKLQEMERRKIDEETHRQMEKEKMEEQVKSHQEAKEIAEKEALVYRTKLQNQESLMEQIERERTENSELKIKVHRVETEYNSYISSERELLERCTALKAENDELSHEIRRYRDEVSRGRDHVERQVAEQKAQWLEEKTNLQMRVDELENELEKLHQKVVAMINSYKKKKKKYNQIISKLKDRNTLISAKLEELTIERDYLKKCVPPEQYNNLRKQWNDLLRRHRDFRSVLLSSELREVQIGDLSFSSVKEARTTDHVNLNESFGFSAINTQNQKDLDYIKERLDILDDHQRHQMDELRTITRMVSPIPRDSPRDSPVPTRDTDADDEFKESESEKSDS